MAILRALKDSYRRTAQNVGRDRSLALLVCLLMIVAGSVISHNFEILGVTGINAIIIAISAAVAVAICVQLLVDLLVYVFDIINLLCRILPITRELSDSLFGIHESASEWKSNLSATLSSVSEIRDKIYRDFYVEVAEHPSMDVVLAFIKQYSNASIFLGFQNEDLVREITKLYNDNPANSYKLYISPGGLKIPDDALKGLTDAAGAVANKKWLWVTDCPRESCALFSPDPHGRIRCIIVRHTPQDAGDKRCWAANIQAGSPYAQYLYDTYQFHHTRNLEQRFLLDTMCKVRCIRKVHSIRVAQSIQLGNSRLEFRSRIIEHEFAATCVEHAQHSVLAFDVLPPKLWRTNYMTKYLEAHGKSDCAEKRRIHAFERGFSELKKRRGEYKEYIEEQRTRGVTLSFVKKEQRDNRSRGFVVVDGAIVFCAEAKRNEEEGGEQPFASFEERVIGSFTMKFNTMLSEALTVEEFSELIRTETRAEWEAYYGTLGDRHANIKSTAGFQLIGNERARRVGPTFEVCYIYAHEDSNLRDELAGHLSVLIRQGRIRPWHDRDIEAGEEWKGEIDEAIERADIILLLVSATFLASDHCHSEMRRAMKRHEKGEARVIPIIVRECSWVEAPFGKLQALPKDGMAVTAWTNRDAAWWEVERGIKRMVDELQGSQRFLNV